MRRLAEITWGEDNVSMSVYFLTELLLPKYGILVGREDTKFLGLRAFMATFRTEIHQTAQVSRRK